jgi:uncharacterized membrane protein
MRSVAVLEIDAPREEVAARFADPRNSPKWMADLERYEAISGEPGAQGSRYQLVSEHPNLNFMATVVERQLPDRVRLSLDAPSLSVAIEVTFSQLPAGRTRIRSVENFRFKGLFGRAMALFARSSIHSAHLRQMEAFRRYAERTHKGIRGLSDHQPSRNATTNPNPVQDAQ